MLFNNIYLKWLTTHPGGSPLQPHKNSAVSKHKKEQNYPCLCLCLGFSQIIIMFPFLLMTLHFSQIGFTDDLTFMVNPPFHEKATFKYIKVEKNVRVIVYHKDFSNTSSIFKIFYLSLQIILPFERSYGDNSSVTLSPGIILM